MLSCFHTLYFETTMKCNYACSNCSSRSNLKNKNWGEELSYKSILHRILEPAYKLSTRFIDFSGGEFLLRKDAFDLLETANNMGFRIGIASNGSTLNNKQLEN